MEAPDPEVAKTRPRRGGLLGAIARLFSRTGRPRSHSAGQPAIATPPTAVPPVATEPEPPFPAAASPDDELPAIDAAELEALRRDLAAELSRAQERSHESRSTTAPAAADADDRDEHPEPVAAAADEPPRRPIPSPIAAAEAWRAARAEVAPKAEHARARGEHAA